MVIQPRDYPHEETARRNNQMASSKGASNIRKPSSKEQVRSNDKAAPIWRDTLTVLSLDIVNSVS